MQYQWNGMEHRWGKRVSVNIPVQVSAAIVAGINGCITNLSLSGALVKANCDLPLHALVEVSIRLPPSQRAAVIVAQVARKVAEDVGVEWCEFAPGAVKDLLRSPSIRLSL